MRMKMNNYVEVICGPMGCGKSEELIRQLTRYTIAGKKAIVFKHVKDTRDGARIRSRNGAIYETNIKIVDNANNILSYLTSDNCKDISVVAIDEAQFFDESIIDVISNIRGSYTVIISGLEKDFKGRPFGYMPQLLAVADRVQKLTAVCMKCKNNQASFTYKKNRTNDTQIEVGGDELYEARCYNCWNLNS